MFLGLQELPWRSQNVPHELHLGIEMGIRQSILEFLRTPHWVTLTMFAFCALCENQCTNSTVQVLAMFVLLFKHFTMISLHLSGRAWEYFFKGNVVLSIWIRCASTWPNSHVDGVPSKCQVSPVWFLDSSHAWPRWKLGAPSPFHLLLSLIVDKGGGLRLAVCWASTLRLGLGCREPTSALLGCMLNVQDSIVLSRMHQDSHGRKIYHSRRCWWQSLN